MQELIHCRTKGFHRYSNKNPNQNYAEKCNENSDYFSAAWRGRQVSKTSLEGSAECTIDGILKRYLVETGDEDTGDKSIYASLTPFFVISVIDST